MESNHVLFFSPVPATKSRAHFTLKPVLVLPVGYDPTRFSPSDQSPVFIRHRRTPVLRSNENPNVLNEAVIWAVLFGATSRTRTWGVGIPAYKAGAVAAEPTWHNSWSVHRDSNSDRLLGRQSC